MGYAFSRFGETRPDCQIGSIGVRTRQKRAFERALRIPEGLFAGKDTARDLQQLSEGRVLRDDDTICRWHRLISREVVS